MKKYLLGPSIFLIAFLIGFLSAPIRFSGFAVGQTQRGPFTAYISTYFVKLSVERESFETIEEADETFKNRIERLSEYVNRQEILELDEKRAVISVETEMFGRGFCVIRKERQMLYHVFSVSLRHVLEFEEQNFPETE